MEATKGARLTKVRLDRAISKHRKKLLANSVKARKDKKARIAQKEECKAWGDLSNLKDLFPI
jgi:hypothetical protein